MTIDTSGIPETITLRVDEHVAVILPSYLGSGNEWKVSRTDGGYGVANLSIEIEEPPSLADGADPERGTPEIKSAVERLVVVGRAVGEGEWTLRLARSFAPDPPAAVHRVHVIVEE